MRLRLLWRSLLDGQAKALTQKAIDLALTGDLTALQICLDRVLPPGKNRPVTFNFPGRSPALPRPPPPCRSVLTAVAAGEITPAEAAEISSWWIAM